VTPVDLLRRLARLWLGRASPVLLLVLVSLGVVVGPSIASAQQLKLSWVDNSGGEAGFTIQRAPSTTGPFVQIAQAPQGVISYTDTTVSLGTTYCYRVAAVNSAGMSAFSNIACGSPSGGFTLTVAKAAPERVFNLFLNGTPLGMRECRVSIRGIPRYGRPRPRRS
jgi:hypothetical protein